MRKEVDFLIKLVKEASTLVNDSFNVMFKGEENSNNFVTNLDYEIEKFLINQIKKEYPNYDIVSEEFNSLASLTQNCFVIDPIDGTKNFSKKLPLWAIQVGCVQKGELVASAVYLPKTNELFYASLNEGAYLNGQRIFATDMPIKNSLISIEGKFKKENVNKALTEITKEISIRKFGSVGVSFSYCASGKVDGTAYLGYNLWDIMAGKLLLTEAGAKVIEKPNSFIIASKNDEVLNKLNEILDKYL